MAEPHPNSRLEAFCDAVFAIALTLLILDVKIPSSDVINNDQDLWLALKHIGPSIFAFVLSFTIILITWVNHHSALRLVNRSSASFVYANGFLLLTVVSMPFPTALLGEYLFTDHAAPAVVIFNAVGALQAVGWILVCGAALVSPCDCLYYDPALGVLVGIRSQQIRYRGRVERKLARLCS